MKKSKLSEAARETKNAYLRRWRRENRDKVREYNRTYWEHKTARAASETNQQKEV